MKRAAVIAIFIATAGCGSMNDYQKNRITDASLSIAEDAAARALDKAFATDSEVEGLTNQ